MVGILLLTHAPLGAAFLATLTHVYKSKPIAVEVMDVLADQDTEQVQALARDTRADEFMLVSDVFDPALRLRSLTLTAQATIAG